MNITRIRQMAAKGDMSVDCLRYLIECHGECEHLDFKEKLAFVNDHDRANFSKDVIGMKNVGGGYIIVGVRDKTWESIGLSIRISEDTKLLRELVIKCSGLSIEVDIVQHEIYFDGAFKIFALILVRSSAKSTKIHSPSICRNDYFSKENWGLRIGDIFVRDSDSTKKLTTDAEFQKLINDLEARHQENDLEQANTLPSPFEVETGLYRILPREYYAFIGRESYKERLRHAVEKDPRIWIVNLHGPGGVGKSALATWLAYEYHREQKFEAILHLSAKELELSTESGIRYLKPTLFSLEDFLNRVLQLFEHSEFSSTQLSRQREVVTEILEAYKTLLILDNMETIGDGRIMEFVRSLPPGSHTKVLLTSRRRTSEWEYPIEVAEFDKDEVMDFVRVRCQELKLDLPYDRPDVIERISNTSGGLPLAIQWTLGEYSKTRDLDRILSRALDSDSPLLEFSFRNSWNVLDEISRQALAVLSIFNEPPTTQLWRTALDWSVEKMDKAIASLVEVTFVTERTEQKSGKVIYHALPITLNFARNELAKFGDLERQTRLRYQQFQNRMDLVSAETYQYTDLFSQFGATTDIEKKAIILCRMAEGQARSLGFDAAEQYYKQALDIDPRSVYALVSYGLFKSELRRDGEALDLMQRAVARSTKKTGFYVYFNYAKVHDQLKDWPNRVSCLRDALKYKPNDMITRHSLGVALGKTGNHREAIQIFDEIIQEELRRHGGPSDSLAIALRTKLISIRRTSTNNDIAIKAVDDVLAVLTSRSGLEYRIKEIEGIKKSLQ